MCVLSVFPTPVGVFLPYTPYQYQDARLPHARGGVSFRSWSRLWCRQSSPRPWGCFWCSRPTGSLHLVFPTPVGVFPDQKKFFELQLRLPHARGGVSINLLYPCSEIGSSPRPWGCFWEQPHFQGQQTVFPTPVGVFPKHVLKS